MPSGIRFGRKCNALEFTEDVTKSVSSSTLQDIKWKKQNYRGRVFVMAVYDFKEAKLSIKRQLK